MYVVFVLFGFRVVLGLDGVVGIFWLFLKYVFRSFCFRIFFRFFWLVFVRRGSRFFRLFSFGYFVLCEEGVVSGFLVFEGLIGGGFLSSGSVLCGEVCES